MSAVKVYKWHRTDEKLKVIEKRRRNEEMVEGEKTLLKSASGGGV